jgi:Lon protease-like protein
MSNRIHHSAKFIVSMLKLHAHKKSMTNFIPIFPLSIVVFPGESLNLHIFEPRYKQLITECRAEAKPFGIPSVINNEVQEFGTLVIVTEIVTVQDNGEMDIKTQGTSLFRILEIIKSVPDKLYSGAIVSYPDNLLGKGNTELMKRVVNAIRELHKLLKITKDFSKADEELTAYDIGHHAGLSLDEEFELL